METGREAAVCLGRARVGLAHLVSAVMKSIRGFLLLGLLSSVVLANFLAAMQGYQAGIRETADLLDRQLENIATALLQNGVTSEATVANARVDPELSGSLGFAFRLSDQHHRILRHSGTIPDALLFADREGFFEANFASHRWRVLVRSATSGGQRVVVAVTLDDRQRITEDIVTTVIFPIVAVLPLLALLTWVILTRGLRPLRALASALESRRVDDLRPVHLDEIPAELRPILVSANHLLTRVDEALLRERHLTADAAHELRTPISALKIHAYNLQQELGAGHGSVQHLSKGLDRLAHMSEQLLHLHRASPERLAGRFEPVDLYELAQQAISRHYAAIAARQQQVELLGETMVVAGDRLSLELLVDNLLLNANKYTPDGSRIEIRLACLDGRPCLSVSDNGPGVAQDEYARLFSRFYRSGGDHHDSGQPGCGLGLAIVKKIADLHGARVSAQASAFTSGLCVRVCFSAGELP